MEYVTVMLSSAEVPNILFHCSVIILNTIDVHASHKAPTAMGAVGTVDFLLDKHFAW